MGGWELSFCKQGGYSSKNGDLEAKKTVFYIIKS